ncbi:uncharacterized protein LOC127871138 [Dreissena polymorpha]|uniref:SH2 domain-containing protein n=1 Tax=Dreissena polymorpha TaxID=45954 RepID=A0A9D4LCI7_DREPO|nr:uncharacterized protein LOC127871138 [Dreissena polymorpha]XP_052269817.1 uncharacterized protein LOC127871138 [Dreissena polymorpha]XP_052269819.1 uncharacterized protein LOC127871138 [Dreissena polymorpha]KAH3856072.1 hypothetical protein DPMN_098652 [Dreissena polymorpha]
MDHQGLNDLSAGSIDDNTRVPETNYALTSASWKKVRDNLEKVRREIESNIYSLPQNTFHQRGKQPVENTEDPSITHVSSNSSTKDETNVKQPHRESGNKEGSEQVYSRYIQCGDRNFMLICEPKNKPQEKVVYKQEGNRNIMIHLRVSSNVYQLVQQVKDSRNMQVIPLDSEGEVWLEIKRRSQVRKQSRSSDTNESIFTEMTTLASSEREKCRSQGKKESYFTDSGSLASSESDNLHYDTHVYKRDVDEDSYHGDDYDNRKGARRRSIEENSYVSNTKGTDEWKDCHYEILSISEDTDLLKMRFSKKREGKLEDLERLVLSHHRVCDFLRDSSNDFDASLCDWMYQSDESIYSYITGRTPCNVTGVEEVNPEDDVIPGIWTEEENEPLYQETKNEELEIPTHQKAIPTSPSTLPIVPPRSPRIGTVVPVRTPVPQVPPVPPHVPTHRATLTVQPAPLPGSNQPLSDDSGFRTSSHSSRRDRIQDCEWYRGQLGKKEAKEELERKPPGTFLVRQATTNTAEPGGSLHVFTLEFVDEHCRIKKLMIMKTGDVYHFKEFEMQTFENISDLVAKVLTSGLEIKDSRTHLWTIFQVKPAWRKT